MSFWSWLLTSEVRVAPWIRCTRHVELRSEEGHFLSGIRPAEKPQVSWVWQCCGFVQFAWDRNIYSDLPASLGLLNFPLWAGVHSPRETPLRSLWGWSMVNKHLGEAIVSLMDSLILTIQYKQPHFLKNELQNIVGKSFFFSLLCNKRELLCLKNRNEQSRKPSVFWISHSFLNRPYKALWYLRFSLDHRVKCSPHSCFRGSQLCWGEQEAVWRVHSAFLGFCWRSGLFIVVSYHNQ